MNSNKIITWRRIVSSSLLLSILWSVGYSQGRPECLQLVRTVYRNLNRLSESATTCRLEYTMVTAWKKNGKQTSASVDMNLIINAKRMQLVNSEMELHQDEHIRVLVMPRRKTIYVFDSDLPKFREERNKIFTAFRDTLAGLCDVSDCRDIGRDKQVTLQLKPHARKALLIRTATLLIDPADQRIRTIDLECEPESPVGSVRVTFKTVDNNYRFSGFDGPILAQVYAREEVLLPKYRGYKVVDGRAHR